MLVSLNDMKDYLGIALIDTSYDTFLTTQLELISEVVEKYCNRKFSQGTYTQTFYRKDFMNLPTTIGLYHFPLISITSIKEKEELVDVGTDITDYRFHIPTAKLEKNWGRFFANGKHLVIEYVAGFATIPAPVKHAVIGLVEERYNKKKNGIDLNFGSDVQRISIPGAISIDFDYSLSSNERKSAFGAILGSYANILDSYRSERVLVGEVRESYVQ